MAEFVIDGDVLILHLSLREKVGGFHGDIRVPLSGVRAVSAPDNAWAEMRGWRMAGTGIPGLIALGTRRHGDGYDFLSVYRQRPTVQVELNGPPRWQRLVVSVDEGVDPVAEADRIASAAGIARI